MGDGLVRTDENGEGCNTPTALGAPSPPWATYGFDVWTRPVGTYAGVWDVEPDIAEWSPFAEEDDDPWYTCLVVRQKAGHLCGYVQTDGLHPAALAAYRWVDEHEYEFGLSGPAFKAHDVNGFNEVEPVNLLKPHGGVSYLSTTSPTAQPAGRLLKLLEADQELKWFSRRRLDCVVETESYSTMPVWFGFDCAKAGDMQPYRKKSRGDYRSWSYVVQQTIEMAETLRAIEAMAGL